VTDIRDGEVLRKNRSWVAQNEKLILVDDSLLRLGKVFHTEETAALTD
jgi:hypothetical protein